MSQKIFFTNHNIEIEVEVNEGDLLLDVIQALGLQIEALCAGQGTCGKCKVRVNGVETLACKTRVKSGMRVEILSTSEEMKILTGSVGRTEGAPSGRIAISIDLGTTTVIVKAIDTGSGTKIGLRAFANPQRIYGADVLSRINGAMEEASLLSGIISQAIDRAIADILQTEASGRGVPEKVVIAGNTAMSYILLNLRCRSLGLMPFEPEYVFKPVYTYDEIFGTDTLCCPVMIYPYISAFIGGDIVSGIVNIERHIETEKEPSYMLADIGTNGEIACRDGSRLIIASAAAGPALEGGNITCGMSGMPGAIYFAAYEGKGRFVVKTIDDKPAAGICGAGVISLMAALLDAKLVSESGAFTDEGKRIARKYDRSFDPEINAFVVSNDNNSGARIIFTQKDVREVQLAKAAIRAGIEILTDEIGKSPKKLYLAGGFGQNLDLGSAIRVGLIPEEWASRIIFAGNTALGGCVDACAGDDPYAPLPIPACLRNVRDINLGSHENFNDKFIRAMSFKTTK